MPDRYRCLGGGVGMGKIDISLNWGYREEEILLKKKKEKKRNWQIGAML